MIIYMNSNNRIYARIDSAPLPGTLQGETELMSEEKVFCVVCMAFISGREEIISVNGSESHLCVNPSGFEFNLLCFAEADCSVKGEPTEEFTWFPGFAWNYALCPLCGSHLGWHYTGADSSFFGLIKDMLLFGGSVTS